MLTTISELEVEDEENEEEDTEKKYPVYPNYTAWDNITVNGGIWDANGKTGQVFKFRHGQNLTLKNLTAMNSYGHTINVSASQNIDILNVTIKDSYISELTPKRNDPENYEKYKSLANREVIHLDYAGPGEGIYKDATAVKNVLIKGCRFENVPCAIGSHVPAKSVKCQDGNKYSMDKAYGTDITITDCTFKNISHYAINLYSHKNVTITGSIFEKNDKKDENGNIIQGLAFIRYYTDLENSQKDINTEGYNTVFKKDIQLSTSIQSDTIKIPNVVYNDEEIIKFPKTIELGKGKLNLRKRLCCKKFFRK